MVVISLLLVGHCSRGGGPHEIASLPFLPIYLYVVFSLYPYVKSVLLVFSLFSEIVQ